MVVETLAVMEYFGDANRARTKIAFGSNIRKTDLAGERERCLGFDALQRKFYETKMKVEYVQVKRMVIGSPIM
jgi:hypothetical protein